VTDTSLIEMFVIVFPLLLMIMGALGFYALGKWLRNRGYGARLDSVDAFINRLQRRSSAVLVPLAIGIGRLGYSLNRLPILGSKQQQPQWDELESRMREDKMYTRH